MVSGVQSINNRNISFAGNSIPLTSAQRELVKSYFGLIHKNANPETVSVQTDALIEAAKRYDIKRESPFKPLALHVIKSRQIDKLRRKKLEQKTFVKDPVEDFMIADNRPSALELVVNKQILEKFYGKLREMAESKDEKTVEIASALTQVYIHGKPFDVVSMETGINVNSIKTIFRRVFKKFREEL